MRADREEPGKLRPAPPAHRSGTGPPRGDDGQEPLPLRESGGGAGPGGWTLPLPDRVITPSRSDFWRISALVLVVVILAALITIRRDAASTPGPASAVDDLAVGAGDPPPESTSMAGVTTSTSEDVPPPETSLVGAGVTTTSLVATSSSAVEEESSTTSAAPATSATTVPATTTTAPPVVVAAPDLCETQTQNDETRGVEVKYLRSDAFASSFRFYGSSQQLLYDTTTLDDNPTNRVLREGYYEREWDVAANPSGYEPRDVYFVSAVEPEGESGLIRCSRTVVTDGS